MDKPGELDGVLQAITRRWDIHGLDAPGITSQAVSSLW